jgi:hypothetical protein
MGPQSMISRGVLIVVLARMITILLPCVRLSRAYPGLTALR